MSEHVHCNHLEGRCAAETARLAKEDLYTSNRALHAAWKERDALREALGHLLGKLKPSPDGKGFVAQGTISPKLVEHAKKVHEGVQQKGTP